METFGKGDIPERQKLARPVEVIIMLGGLVMFFALAQLFTQLRAQEQRGYKNRAVICDMAGALGLHENGECQDPHVLPYRDREAATTGTTGARNSRATMVVVCRVARSLYVTVPECSGIG